MLLIPKSVQFISSFEVHLKDMIVSHIDPLEFMDSPEWIGADEYHSTTYQVNMRCFARFGNICTI